MLFDAWDLDAQAQLWIGAAALALLAAVAAVGEHRRTRRRNLDRVGWMPWNLIQVLAALGAIVSAALALKS